MSKSILAKTIKETKDIMLEEHNVQNLKRIFKNIETIDYKCKVLEENLKSNDSYITDSILLDKTVKHLHYLIDCKRPIIKADIKPILKLIKDKNILDWNNLDSQHYSKYFK